MEEYKKPRLRVFTNGSFGGLLERYDDATVEKAKKVIKGVGLAALALAASLAVTTPLMLQFGKQPQVYAAERGE